MAGITNLRLIEPEMRRWELEKAIQEWNARFQQFEARPQVSESCVLELRLMLGAERAYLEGRNQPKEAFSELKPGHAQAMAMEFEQGAVVITSDALALWSAAYYGAWVTGGWWSFPYTDPLAKSKLSRLLRMPLAPDRVVTRDGQPLQRMTEPLRLVLRSPGKEEDSYELALATSEDLPAPRILCTLPGQPTLYLTDGALFSGPPADALETEISRKIPCAALETTNGLRFLHAAGVSLPQHLSRRIRTLPIQVTISCSLRPAFYHSQKEDISLHIVARAPGMKTERFTPGGWVEDWEERSRAKSERDDGLLIMHDIAAKRHFPHVIKSLDLKWEDSFRLWTWRVTKDTPEQLLAWLESLPREIEVLLDRELASLRKPPIRSEISLDVVEADIDWFDLKVALKVSDTTLTLEELKLLLNARGGYVRLGTRGWRRIEFNVTPEDEEQLARLGLDVRDFTSEPQRFHALQLADAAAKRLLPPEHAETIERRASELKVRITPPLPSDIRAKMRPYQTEGFHFLAYLACNRFGGVLADDMGLGKTLQSLAWLAWLRERSRDTQSPAPNPSLTVCPKSVMDNWRAEGERFYPSLRVRLWHGEPAAELAAAREQSDLIVINYTQLRSLSPDIAAVPWLAAILDEAQFIKNPSSQTAQAARSLQAEYRLALTGTPIENRLVDLWSIFSFSMPGVLGNRAQFVRRFEGKDNPLARRRLAARVRPFLLRRTKQEVEKDLPDRVEEDLLCEMEGEQKTLYSAELKRARQLVLGLKTPEELNVQRFNILTSLLRLRQICCHPKLVDASLGSAESAKLSALEDLVEPLIEEGHKTLVFSQFITMLDLLREKCKAHGWPCFYLAGETENRGQLVREFQSVAGGAVFLLSLRAGGFGLNLTAASYVVLFDPWWNPAVENQAIDRTHRIGQTSKVIAYRLLMRDSIEQKVRALQKRKAALAEDVLGEERFAQGLDLEDLRFLFAESGENLGSDKL
jgi:SNF2 family DNA or RNA helicase